MNNLLRIHPIPLVKIDKNFGDILQRPAVAVDLVDGRIIRLSLWVAQDNIDPHTLGMIMNVAIADNNS